MNQQNTSEQIIDVNINLSRWPTRRTPMDELPDMVAMLKSHSVAQAWVGSLDGLLHKDLAAVNERLTEQCRAVREVDLRPIGSINPLAPDWQEDVRRCLEVHGMHGVRVHPNYHGYTLDHPNFTQFLKLAEAKRLIVMLPIQMEDERVMHPLLRVKPVDLEPLKALLPQFPELRMVILNAGKGQLAKVSMLVRLGKVFVDIATVDGLAVIEEVVRDVGLDRIMFGSNSPLFYFESAKLKLREAELTLTARQAIHSENARLLVRT